MTSAVVQETVNWFKQKEITEKLFNILIPTARVKTHPEGFR
jgi:hypothetical protein